MHKQLVVSYNTKYVLKSSECERRESSVPIFSANEFAGQTDQFSYYCLFSHPTLSLNELPARSALLYPPAALCLYLSLPPSIVYSALP